MTVSETIFNGESNAMLTGQGDVPIQRLRMNITERCNFSCFFCHNEGVSAQETQGMSISEIANLVRVGANLGITEVKLLGGEALMRPDLEEIVARISPFVEEVSLTTNGCGLAARAEDLQQAGLDRVNISLHSTNAGTFERITGVDAYDVAIEAIQAAKELGLEPVKLDRVMLRGVNVADTFAYLDWCADMEVDVKLLELSPSSTLSSEEFRSLFLNLNDYREEIIDYSQSRGWTFDSTGDGYVIHTDSGDMTVELLRLCNDTSTCTARGSLQVTADGHLKPCFWRNDNLVACREALKEGADATIEQALRTAASRVRNTCNFFER
ncbi:MAG: GTP 3',8-cyclase MoaA [Promethearchaeati archaeon]